MESLITWLEWIGETLTLLIMLFSLAGLIIPIFPGTVIILAVALIYGAVSGFSTVGIVVSILMAILAVVSAVADNVLMGAKARENGASWGSILLAFGGGVVFTFAFPPVGGVIAAPLILFLAERRRQGDTDKAMRTVKALVIGWGWGFVVRLGIGLLMVALWAGWALSN